MKTIDVFFTINDGYAKYLAVCISSIIVNTRAFVHFYILDGGISEDNKRKISQLKKIREFSVEYLGIDKAVFNKVPQHSRSYVSNETNYRFIISSLKPDLDKCIFLDADLVLHDDIEKLWEVDLRDNYIAAVADRDPLKPGSWVTKLPLPQSYTYVNTGVIIVNLKKWREDKIEKKLLENAEKYRKLLCFPDQDTLNITLASHVLLLPCNFNAMPAQSLFWNKKQREEAFGNPIVVHYAGDKKPWEFPHEKMSDIFFHYARMTPFYEEILYANFVRNKSASDCNLPISSPKNSLSDELVRFKKIMLEVSRLPEYRRKLQRIRWKVHFSLGERRQRYLRRKEQIKNQIKAAEKFMKDIQRACKTKN